MKKWTEEAVASLTPNQAFGAAIKAGLYKPGMDESDVRNALVRPFGDKTEEFDVPEWAREEKQSQEKNLWDKLMAKLPEPIRSFLQGIEVEEVLIPFFMNLIDNAQERRKYVTQDQMDQVIVAFQKQLDALGTPDNEDDKAAKSFFDGVGEKGWWNQIVIKVGPSKSKK